jgi:hypothetical protein
MIIQRNTSLIIPGCLDDAVAAVKAEIERVHANARVLTAVFGPFDQMVFEIRFENIAEHEKFWEDWFALPTTAQFYEQWPRLYRSGGTNEIWEIQQPVAGFGTGKIVNRRTFLVKIGKMQELIELLKTTREGTYPFEIETTIFGPSDTIALDFNFENIAAHDKTWADWAASEQAGPYFEKWFQLIEPGGTNEIWEVG